MEVWRLWEWLRNLAAALCLACMSVSVWAVPQTGGFGVQIGAFEDPGRAQALVERMRRLGLPVFTEPFAGPEGLLSRVVVGSYDDREAARLAQGQLAAEGWPGFLRTLSAPSLQVAAEGLDSLFLDDPETPVADAPSEEEGGLEALFGLEEETPVEKTGFPWGLSGFYQAEAAYTYPSPDHWSKLRNILEVGRQGAWNAEFSWRWGVRAVVDPVYQLTSFYDDTDVADDQEFEVTIRETYVDASAGDWDFRLGRQHIIWGEMVALFVADVVSAKDLREFVLPDFQLLRIPQWAARAEYFGDDWHLEGVWIPYMTYNDIGVEGGDYYPFPAISTPGFEQRFRRDDEPSQSLEHSAYGAKVSVLKDGWDLAGFFYSSMDAMPAFEREVVLGPTPTLVYTPVHKRIRQWGATLGKDLGLAVLKAEAIYTADRRFEVENLTDRNGLVTEDVIDYIVGLNFAFPHETRFNFQAFHRWIPDRDHSMLQDGSQPGLTWLASTRALHPDVESEILLVHRLDQTDWMLQAKASWFFASDWRLVAGWDAFGGDELGIFGRFDEKDRVYTEVRYSF